MSRAIRLWYRLFSLIWQRVCVVFAARVTITQGASLNLFSSREQEIEQRAQLLKRLSFTVFCSDMDQYQRSMPEIQGGCARCSLQIICW